MASTVITTIQNASYTLLSGEFLAVLESGAIWNIGGNGVTTTGTENDVQITVLGEIVTRNDPIRLGGTSNGTFSTSGIANNTVSVGATGSVSVLNDFDQAVSFYGLGSALINHGTITATAFAVTFQGVDNTVINTGLITSANGEAIRFSNSATTASGPNIVNNSGTLVGTIGVNNTSAGFGLELVNSGTITGISSFGIFSDGGAGLEDTMIFNSGLISGPADAIHVNRAAAEIRSSGTIAGDITLDSEADLLVNSGEILGAVSTDNGDDIVRNSGMIDGAVTLGAGNDSYRGTGDGQVAAAVSGGSNNDTLVGASRNDTLLGENGNDVIRGMGGADELEGGIGDDSILGDGGDDVILGDSGLDTLRGGAGDDNIDGGADADMLFGNSGVDTLLGGLGNDTLFGGTGADSLDGGDNDDVLNGGGDGDEILGDAGLDTLRGEGGSDTLNGGDGADVIQGGEGNDLLIGGLGKDILNGGLGADTFRFTATNQSDVGANRDVIQDFESGVDTIDLGALPGVLSYVGGAALPGGGTAAVRAAVVGVNTIVQIDTDGDGSIDSEILLSFVTATTADDFIL